MPDDPRKYLCLICGVYVVPNADHSCPLCGQKAVADHEIEQPLYDQVSLQPSRDWSPIKLRFFHPPGADQVKDEDPLELERQKLFKSVIDGATRRLPMDLCAKHNRQRPCPDCADERAPQPILQFASGDLEVKLMRVGHTDKALLTVKGGDQAVEIDTRLKDVRTLAGMICGGLDGLRPRY